MEQMKGTYYYETGMPWDLGSRLEAKTGNLLGFNVSSLCSSVSLLGLLGITLF